MANNIVHPLSQKWLFDHRVYCYYIRVYTKYYTKYLKTTTFLIYVVWFQILQRGYNDYVFGSITTNSFLFWSQLLKIKSYSPSLKERNPPQFHLGTMDIPKSHPATDNGRISISSGTKFN